MNDASALIPQRRSLKALGEASAGCQACPLWKGTTKTVFGEGLKRSRLMLVGEPELGLLAVGTVHPSAILRAPDDKARRAERARFTEDLRVAAQALG